MDGVEPTGARGWDGRLVIATKGILWGLGIGATAGAVAGTCLFPGLGTVVGLVFGIGAAVVPALLGSIALVAVAAPGTSVETYRRNSRRVLLVLAAVLAVVGPLIAVVRAHDGSRSDLAFRAAGIVGILVALGLLAWSSRTLTALRPAPAGTRERAAFGLLGGYAIVLVLIGGAIVWDVRLNPDARARHDATALRDAVGRDLGTDIGAGDWDSSTEVEHCPNGNRRIHASGSGTVDARSDPLATAARALERRGFRVQRGVGDANQSDWVYGRAGATAVTVYHLGHEPSVSISVETGCRLGPPT